MLISLDLILLLVAVVLGYSLQQYFHTQRLIRVGVALVAKTKPFARSLAGGRSRILIAGDSTGVGVGASRPENSIAGLVGKKYPQAEIVNVAVSGAKIADVPSQLAAVKNDSFDLVMLHIGGNDVVKFTRYADIQRDLKNTLRLAKSKGRYVLLTSTGNVGTAPLLPAVSHRLYERRTCRVRELCIKAVASFQSSDVRYTDLFRERAYDPYALEPQKYYAADLFHPSDEGYADWWQLISKELGHFNL